MNLVTLSDLIQDKQSSVQFLQQHGILHNPRMCTNNHPMILELGEKRDRWRCRRRDCREDCPVRQKTWLTGSKLSYRNIILFIYCWSREMATITFCEHELDIKKNFVLDWNNFLREVCAASIIANPTVIGGPGTTVDIDESVFTCRKNNQDRVLPQQRVFGGICRETKECFMYTIPDCSETTVFPIIKQCIRAGSTIMSDQSTAYNGIGALGYTHKTVNLSDNVVNAVSGAHTHLKKRSWGAVKERNKRLNGSHRNLVESYMCEFMWRKRQETTGNDVFENILRDISIYFPPE